MYEFSFIDFGWKNFLTDGNGKVLILKFDSFQEAEDWLLDNGHKYGWTNEGVKYWCWDVELGNVDIDEVGA